MQIENQKRYRAFLVILVYLIIAIIGLRYDVDFEKNELHACLIYMVLAFTLTHVSIVDSRITGKPIPSSSYWLVLIFYGIAVPICIIRSHGIRKGVKLIILNSIGFLVVLSLFLYIHSLIYYDGKAF